MEPAPVQQVLDDGHAEVLAALNKNLDVDEVRGALFALKSSAQVTQHL